MYVLSLLVIKNFLSFQEQRFEFRQGEAVLVVGDNQDQYSQKGNGAGKSALIEAIAVAISGKPLRDVLTKELIFKGAPCAEITLVLENTVLNHALTINRAIYADTTAAQYGALINAVDQGKYYADWNGFNDWVFKTIGISKNDFFGNYLVTRDNYEPFLRIGDKEKKEFVNRYSGASVVDKVFPAIQADSARLEVEIGALDKDLIQNRAKQEVFAEQIQELNDEVNPEKVQLQIEELENTVSEKQEEQAEKKDQRSALNKELDELQQKVKKFKYSKDYDKETAKLSKQYSDNETLLKEKTQELTTVKDKFKSKADKITAEENKLKARKLELQDDIKEYEKFESEINQHLADEIECPKCKHKFCLRDEEYDVEAAREQLPTVQKSIGEFKTELEQVTKSLNTGIQQKRTALNLEINKAQEKINQEISVIQQKQTEVATNNRLLKQEKEKEDQQKRTWENTVNDKLRVLKNFNEDIEELTTEILKLKGDIETLQNSGIDQKRLDELNKSIEKLVRDEENLKNAWDLKRKEKERIDTWELNFIKFKSHLANKSIKNIQDYTNVFLEAMASDLTIEMSGYRPLANKKKIKEEITTIVKRNGFPTGSYGSFSGGERGRIDISVILANQELINLNCEHGKGLAFLGIDEILDQMDDLGLELLVDSLQNLNKTIMIVSQQTNINNVSEHTLIVRKKNKISTIV